MWITSGCCPLWTEKPSRLVKYFRKAYNPTDKGQKCKIISNFIASSFLSLLGFQLPTDYPSWVPVTDQAFFKYCLRCQRSLNWAGILSSQCRGGTRSSGFSPPPTSNIKEDWEELAVSGEFYIPALSHSHGLTATKQAGSWFPGVVCFARASWYHPIRWQVWSWGHNKEGHSRGKRIKLSHKFPVLKGSETAFKTHL